MELNLSNEDAAFRDEARAFVAENYPPEMRVPNPQADLTKEQSLLWHVSSVGGLVLLEIEREKGESLMIDDIHDQVAGIYP